MAPIIIVSIAVLAMTACNQTAPVLGQSPASSQIVRGNYARLADCTYRRLERYGAAIQKADMPTMGASRITFEGPNNIRLASVTFTRTAAQSTRVDFSSVQTAWGTSSTWEKLQPAVQECSAG